MRPCQHCNAPLENQRRRCPACGAEQVATVGLDAPTVDSDTWPDDCDAELAEETLFRRILLGCAGATTVGVPLIGWIAGGPFGLMVGVFTLAALILGCQLCCEGLFS